MKSYKKEVKWVLEWILIYKEIYSKSKEKRYPWEKQYGEKHTVKRMGILGPQEISHEKVVCEYQVLRILIISFLRCLVKWKV